MTRAMQADEGQRGPFFLWLAAYVVLLSAIQVAVLGSSLAALRLSRLLAVGILGVSLLAAWVVWHGWAAGEPIEPPWAGALDRRWGRPLAGAFVALYLFLFLCAVIVPDVSWDANSYHLPVIQQWFERGQVVWIEAADAASKLMNGQPKAGEVLSLFLCTLVRPALSKTYNLVYLPLGSLGIASIAQALGASRGASLAAGAALLLVPINLGQSATAYVDSAFGSAVIAWLAVTVRLRRLDRRRFWLQAFVLGCALGQVIGLKGTGVLLGALGSLALCGVHLGSRPTALSLRALVAWWLCVAICALAVGGFWYARNLAHGHSPLYPVRVSVAGFILWPGADPYALSGPYAVDGWLADWPTPVQVAITWLQGGRHWPRSIIGFDMRPGGLGFLWLLGCLPAVVALLRRRLQMRTGWRNELVSQPLWLLVAIVSVGFVLQPYPWWSRYTIWIYGLGLPCLAAAQGSWTGRFGRAWLATCAAIAILEAGIVLARWQIPLVGFALRDQPGGPSVRVPSHFFPPWAVRGTILEQLAHGHDTIGIGPLEWWAEPVAGILSQPVGAREIYFAPADLETDFSAWYERVRPRYVVMNKVPEIPEPMARLRPQVYQTHSLTVLQFW